MPVIRRVRLHRERTKLRSAFVAFVMNAVAVDRLIALHWLKAENRHDSDDVTDAFLDAKCGLPFIAHARRK